MQRGLLIAGAAGLIGCALAFALGYIPFVAHNLFSPGQIFRSYLVAYIFWLGIGLGSLVILMLQHLTGGVWGLVIRRVLESGSRTLLLLAVFFVPIFYVAVQGFIELLNGPPKHQMTSLAADVHADSRVGQDGEPAHRPLPDSIPAASPTA